MKKIGNIISINEYINKEGELVQPNIGIVQSVDGRGVVRVKLTEQLYWVRPARFRVIKEGL